MFRAFLMMGEYTNLFIFGALMASDSRRFYHFLLLTNEEKDRQVSFCSSKLWMVATSLLNTAGSSMHLTALLLLPLCKYSTVTRVQMLPSAHLMFSTVISRLLLGRPILRHFYLVSLVSILGFITVSFSLTVDKQEYAVEAYTNSGQSLGIALIVGYLVCNSLHGCLQEVLLRDNAISYQRMVGLKGMFRLQWSFFMITLASHITCIHEDISTLGATVSDTIEAVYKIMHRQRLMFYCAISVLAVLTLKLEALQLARLVSITDKAF